MHFQPKDLKTSLINAVFLLVTFLFSELPASAQNTLSPSTAEPGIIVARFQPTTDVEAFTQLFNKSQNLDFQLFIEKNLIPEWNYFLLKYEPAHLDPAYISKKLTAWQQILFAHPSRKINTRSEPNDPNYSDQWGLEKIQVEEVWKVTTGGVTMQGDTIVVAIIDQGFDVNHIDLKQNLWKNPKEIPFNNRDDDRNGLVDDINGWNFTGENNRFDVTNHGTAVAGIIGAKGNNERLVAGVNWNVKMMLFQIENDFHAVQAYQYVLKMRRLYSQTGGQSGAFVVVTNASLGIDDATCDDFPEWGEMYDSLGQAGVLSVSSVRNQRLNIDEKPDFPTNCPSPFLITVTNSTKDDVLDQSAGFGKTTVDLAAPGGEFGEGTVTTGAYDALDTNFPGASASAPHVAGVVALLYSLPCAKLIEEAKTNPATTALQLKSIILNGTDPLVSLQDKTVTGGRLNALKCMDLVSNYCDIPSEPLAILKIGPNPVREQIEIEYITDNFSDHQVKIHNSIGQIVVEESFQPIQFGQRMLEISVKNLAIGTYFLTISNPANSVSWSFVKS